MKRSIILGLLVFFLCFFGFQKIFAQWSFLVPSIWSSGSFGGKINNIETPQIQELESTGYLCAKLGVSVEIIPIGSPFWTPRNYIIPIGITSKTNTALRIGQIIIGKYSGTTTVVCTHPTTGDSQTVSLSNIILYGTSK